MRYLVPLTAWVSLSSQLVVAQIVPDQTLPNNSLILSPNGQTILINGGTQAGNNLFHSFQEFNVNSGQFVLFNNRVDVTNIFSRVTGNNISLINGTLSANGTANLFLINRNGITFGQNANILLGGSFIGTSASQVTFADGGKLDVLNPNQSLLTVSAPIGLTFTNQNGSITVQGTQNNLVGGDITGVFNRVGDEGLTTLPNRTISLISNEINFDRGNITSLNGNINLISLSKGQVSLDSITLVPTAIQAAGSDIHLRNSSIDLPSFKQGNIRLWGKNFTLSEGTVIRMTNLGDQSLGNILLESQGNINISGTFEGVTRTSIVTGTLQNGTGGNIQISGHGLLVEEGALIGVGSFGAGNSGNINVELQNKLTISGFEGLRPEFSSTITSITTESGTGGNITIHAPSINIFDGGILASVTSGTGASGNTTITSKNIFLSGTSPVVFAPSLIGATSFGLGNAGFLDITTDSLIVLDGGRIDSSTLFAGNSGRIAIRASDLVEVSGQTEGAINPSTIISSANIINEQNIFDLPSIPSGNSGDLLIDTPRLVVTNGASISVNNIGLGRGGDLQINTSNLFLTNNAQITAATQSGQGGNIFLNGNNLSLNNSQITATAGGLGDGGNITLNNNATFLLNNSQITANAFEGRGGNIEINTGVLFQDPSSTITASSELGVDGEVTINQIFDVQNLVSPLTLNPQQKEIELRVECTEIELIQSGDLHGARMLESGYVAKLKPNSTVQPTSNGVEWKEGRWVTTRYFTPEELDSWQCSIGENSLLQSEKALSN